MTTENGFTASYGALRFVFNLKGYNPENPGDTDYAAVEYVDTKGKYGRPGYIYGSSAFLAHDVGLVGSGEEVELTDSQRNWVSKQMDRMDRIMEKRFPKEK